MTIETAPDTVIKFHHLLLLCRAMRLAQKGNLATGERPDPETAMRLETALDFFIAGCRVVQEGAEIQRSPVA